MEKTNMEPRPRKLWSDRTGSDHGAPIRTSTEEGRRRLPVDGGPRDDGAEDGGEERVVKLREKPAGFLLALLEERLRLRVQVALNEHGANPFSQQLWTAAVPLRTHSHRDFKVEMKESCAFT